MLRAGPRRVLAALVVVATALAAPPALANDAAAERPAYAPGYHWPLAGGGWELARIDRDVYVFAGPDAELRLTRNLALVSARRGADFLDLTTPAALTWPLRAGAWGVGPSSWRASRGLDLTVWRSFTLGQQRLIWSVEQADDVVLDAGPIRTLRLTYRMVATGIAAPDVVEWEITMWYAPDAGAFVRGVDRTFGVVSFELDRAASVARLRRAAGFGPLIVWPPLDHRARHREAAATLGCGLRCPAPGGVAP